MTVVGFDFGTTNSLVSVVVGDRVIRFEDEGQPIPSVVSYEGGQTIVGREARKRLGVAGLGVHGSAFAPPRRCWVVRVLMSRGWPAALLISFAMSSHISEMRQSNRTSSEI